MLTKSDWCCQIDQCQEMMARLWQLSAIGQKQRQQHENNNNNCNDYHHHHHQQMQVEIVVRAQEACFWMPNGNWKLAKCINYTPRWPIKVTDSTIVVPRSMAVVLRPTVDHIVTHWPQQQQWQHAAAAPPCIFAAPFCIVRCAAFAT